MTVAALGPLQLSALKSGATDLIATRGEAAESCSCDTERDWR